MKGIYRRKMARRKTVITKEEEDEEDFDDEQLVGAVVLAVTDVTFITAQLAWKILTAHSFHLHKRYLLLQAFTNKKKKKSLNLLLSNPQLHSSQYH